MRTAASSVPKAGPNWRAFTDEDVPEVPSVEEMIADLVGGADDTLADPTTRRLNKRHAVVRHAGKTFIADVRPEGIELGPVSDLRALYANDLVAKRGDPSKMEAASYHWISDAHRRTFSGVVFDPSGSAPATALNLFRGWAVKPNAAGSCERILRLLRQALHGVLVEGT